MTADAGQSPLAQFIETVEQLPPHSGVTFRGCPDGVQFARPGQSVVTRTVLPTSLDPDIATEGRVLPAVYAIRSLRGRLIAAFSARRDEVEVVFVPGTLFYLAGAHRVENVTVHLVFELTLDDGPPHLEEQEMQALADRAESTLRSRWAAASKEFTSIAGKFAGDIA